MSLSVGSGGVGSNVQDQSTTTTNQNAYATVQTNYGASLSSGTGAITYYGSDYGAISAAFNLAQAATSESSATARFALSKASEIVKEQGAGALSTIIKPFGWVILGVSVVVGFVVWAIRRKG